MQIQVSVFFMIHIDYYSEITAVFMLWLETTAAEIASVDKLRKPHST